MTSETQLAIEAVSTVHDGTHRSDVIVTCTPSRIPFLTPSDVPPGAFVAAIGADSPEKRELDARLVAAHKLVVDSAAQCAAVGELHHAIAGGFMEIESIYADLADLVIGRRVGRTSEDETFIFDATGTAFQDVAAAAIAYHAAVRAGVGVQVDVAGS
jgi:ornithine cyclodeaminase/alanine dehydrogenase-like protein (mu-crystallin family)